MGELAGEAVQVHEKEICYGAVSKFRALAAHFEAL